MDPITGTLLATLILPPPVTRMPSWAVLSAVKPNVDQNSNKPLYEENFGEGTGKSGTILKFQPKVDFRLELIKKISAWIDQGYGWDSPNVAAPPRSSVRLAQAIIDSLPSDFALPKPMVSSEGKLGFYWDSPDKYIDVELEDSDSISLYVRDKRNEEEIFEDDLDIKDHQSLDLMLEKLKGFEWNQNFA